MVKRKYCFLNCMALFAAILFAIDPHPMVHTFLYLDRGKLRFLNRTEAENFFLYRFDFDYC